MSKSRHNRSWCNAKQEAWRRQDGKCDVCLQPILLNGRKDERMVGHHVRSRQVKDAFTNTSDNCVVRHAWCEVYAHAFYPQGNLPATMKGDGSEI